jgi:Stage II sporulation protein
MEVAVSSRYKAFQIFRNGQLARLQHTLMAWAGAVILAAAILAQAPAAKAAFDQFETITVLGFGNVPTETDYVPNVVFSENGAASYEALKAQAVAARTFAYYKMRLSGYIQNGTQDQVYHSDRGWAQQIHFDAAADTEGEILTIRNFNDLDILIASFYVAGAVPSGPTPEPNPGDWDYSNTEKWVTHTYPTGVIGGDNPGTPLGFIGTPTNPNWPNRGAKSQNGANFMGQQGISYVDILKYYYGADIQLETVAPTIGQPALQNLKTLTDFELNNGYFGNAPGFSTHNLNLGPATITQRVTSDAHSGVGDQLINIDLDEASGSEFLFHHVAGTEYAGFDNLFTGQREANLAMQPLGSIGFWLKTDSPGLTVSLNLDDDYDGTEQALFQSVTTDGQWHKYEWSLEDPDLWSAANYDSGDGILGESFTLDSIVFAGNTDSLVFLDDIFYLPPPLGPQEPLPGDMNGDWFVGINDLNTLLSFWNQTVPRGDKSQGDLAGDGDGHVGLDDLGVILTHWNTGTPPAVNTLSIPEPGSLLLMTALLPLARRRR